MCEWARDDRDLNLSLRRQRRRCIRDSLMLVGTMGGSMLIIPGALVLADITEVVAMFIRSTYISLMAHNRVIGIQEDIVVTAALEHDARFGAGTGGDV